MRLDVCVNEMTPFGPFAAVVKSEMTFDSDSTEAGLPTRRDGGPATYESVPLLKTWTWLKVSCIFVHCVVRKCRRWHLLGIVHHFCTRWSATGAGINRGIDPALLFLAEYCA